MLLRRVGYFIFALLIGVPAQAEIVDLSDHSPLAKVYFVPEPKAADVRVQLYLDVGEADRTGPEGLAHYLEHLVAWSADKVHGDGFKARHMNASTSPYWTSYYNSGPPDNFENMLRHAKAVFRPINLTTEFMQTERDVVMREYDLRLRENPYGQLYDKTKRHLHGDHAAGRSVMGTPESLATITYQDAIDFHKERYDPSRAYLIIHGNLKQNQVRVMVEKHLSELKDIPDVPRRIYDPLPEPPSEGIETKLSILERSAVQIQGYVQKPDALSKKDMWYASILLQDVLNSGHKGGLRKPLYFDNFIVASIDTFFLFTPLGDIQSIIAFTPEDGIAENDAETRVYAVLDKMVDKGVPPETVETIRNKTIEQIERLKESKPNYSFQIAETGLLNLGYAISPETHVENLRNVTLEQINSLLRAIVKSRYQTTGIARKQD